MTSFLSGRSGPGGEAILKLAQVCVVSENMVHGKVNPLPYPDNYPRSGFAGVHGGADPSSDGTEQTACSSANGGYLIYTNTRLVTELSITHTQTSHFHFPSRFQMISAIAENSVTLPRLTNGGGLVRKTPFSCEDVRSLTKTIKQQLRREATY